MAQGTQSSATVVDGKATKDADKPIVLSSEQRKKLESAKDVLFQLNKGTKSIQLYRHNVTKYGEYMEKTSASLERYCAEHGVLTMKVEQQDFQLAGMPGNPSILPVDGDPLIPYKFYQTGIRQIILRPGCTTDEIVQFALICTTNFDHPSMMGEDALSLMWKATFEHIEYVVVEGFKVDGMDEEQVKIEVEKIIAYLQALLRSDNEDYIRFARLSAGDLENKLEDIEQMKGAVVVGETASDKLRATVKTEVKEDETTRLMNKLVLAVFQVISDGVKDMHALEEVFTQLLDALLLQEDLGAVNQILVKFRSLERDPENAHFAQTMRGFFLGQMGQEVRLRRLGEVLQTSRPKTPQDFARYLTALSSDCVPVLLDVLDTLEIAENRKIVTEALVILGKDNPDPFLNRLKTDRSQLVRDMLYIIDRIDFPDKIRMFAEVTKNPNLAVRLEALGVVSKSKTEGARNLIVEALEDGTAQIRMHAARLLPVMDGDRGSKDLIKLVKDPVFGKKERREQETIFAALGACNVPGAVSYLATMLNTKPGLLNKKKVMEDKLLAIAGLVHCPSVPSYKLLQTQAEEKANDDEVVAAAKKALAAMKRQLFGEQEG
jgi:HEAT repeat protein